MFPRFVNFKDGTTLTYGMRFLLPGYCDSVRTLRQAPLSCDLDLGSISAALPGNYRNLFYSESVASHWRLIFAISRRPCPHNTRETTCRDVTVCKTRCR